MEEVLASAALVAAGLALLCLGGNWLVGGGEKIAKRFRVSSFVIGMTVIAYGTSTPELAASVAAATGGYGAIILGNIIGSNIANVGMVIGISAVLIPLAVGRYVLRKEIPVMIGASVLLVALSADGEVSQYDGFILLAGLGVVTYRTMRIIKGQRAEAGGAGPSEPPDGRPEPGSAQAHQPVGRFYARNVGTIGAGIALLYVGAILTVDHAAILAKTFGLSEKVIGLTVVAIGTSLPELITSIMAIRRGQQDIGVGNIIGSNIYNVLMIMGVGAALGGVAISDDVWVDYGIMLAFGAALLAALKTGRVGRRVGICLAAGYAAYLGVSLLK
ncbi:MAG: calcium/sodium antiporter [Thaumarchaeota archaeon]|nr:calcium/sodium antiporter [Nitrososphaerota archaeon]